MCQSGQQIRTVSKTRILTMGDMIADKLCLKRKQAHYYLCRQICLFVQMNRDRKLETTDPLIQSTSQHVDDQPSENNVTLAAHSALCKETKQFSCLSFSLFFPFLDNFLNILPTQLLYEGCERLFTHCHCHM